MVRHGRLRCVGMYLCRYVCINGRYLELKSGDAWVSTCRNVEVIGDSSSSSSSSFIFKTSIFPR